LKRRCRFFITFFQRIPLCACQLDLLISFCLQRFVLLAIDFSGSPVAKSSTTQHISRQRNETKNRPSHDFTIILYPARDERRAVYAAHKTAICGRRTVRLIDQGTNISTSACAHPSGQQPSVQCSQQYATCLIA
jgi:hypothetical protein